MLRTYRSSRITKCSSRCQPWCICIFALVRGVILTRDTEQNVQGKIRLLTDQEFPLVWIPSVNCSYRRDEERKREFVVTSLGRIAFIDQGKLGASGTTFLAQGAVSAGKAPPAGTPVSQTTFLAAGRYCQSSHVASMRELKVEGTTVTMVLRGREFILRLTSAAQLEAVCCALNTAALMLFCGPPPFKTSNVNLKVPTCAWGDDTAQCLLLEASDPCCMPPICCAGTARHRFNARLY